MQITHSKNQPARTTAWSGRFVEKVLWDKEGRLVRATFCVYENGGRVKARLVSVIYLAEKALQSAAFALSGFVSKKISPIVNFFGKAVASPYFSVETLYQNGSKPRAPSL